MYPEYAEINGKEYKIDTSYKTALRCFEVIEDEEIPGTERTLAIIYLLFDFIPKENIELFFEKAMLYLQCGESLEEQKSKKKDMDFIQDQKYINSSFMSDYHIDLSKTDLHFWQYIELIQGLTEDSSLNRVRNIRNYDLSEIKDEKTKNKIMEAQKELALKNKDSIIQMNDTQKSNINAFYEANGL
jgi:hypothetical protein